MSGTISSRFPQGSVPGPTSLGIFITCPNNEVKSIPRRSGAGALTVEEMAVWIGLLQPGEEKVPGNLVAPYRKLQRRQIQTLYWHLREENERPSSLIERGEVSNEYWEKKKKRNHYEYTQACFEQKFRLDDLPRSFLLEYVVTITWLILPVERFERPVR